MKKKKLMMVIFIPVIVFFIVTFPWTLMVIVNFFTPGPPTPETTYGEFPFRIVYEIGEERYVIEDTLVCEYAGRNKESYTGKDIKWKGRLLSGSKITRRFSGTDPAPRSLTKWTSGYGIVILDRVDTGYGWIGQLEIDIGSAQYYLGYYELGDYFPGRGYDYGKGFLDGDTLFEKYGVKIIETTFSEPLIGNGIEIMKE